ncbi:MAG: PAS domain S-box protein, partial [Candidatus Eremiobacterota bacterium]
NGACLSSSRSLSAPPHELPGRTGELVDPRGVPVLAASSHLRSVPWVVVAQMDRQDALEEYRRSLEWMLALLVALLGMGWALWRSSQHLLWMEVSRSDARLGYLIDRAAADPILFLDENLNVRDCNERFLEVYRVPLERLPELNFQDIHPGDSTDHLEEARTSGVSIFEAEHLRLDGTALPVELNIRYLIWDGRPTFLCMVRDLTLRRQAEQRAARHHRTLTLLYRIRAILARGVEPVPMLQEAVQTLVEGGLFSNACVLQRGEAGLTPIASTCPVGECCAQREVVQTTVKELRTVCQGLLAASPIYRAGALYGALTVTGSQPAVLDEETLSLIEGLAQDLGHALALLESRRELVEKEQRLAMALRIGQMGSWMLDVETGAVWMSESTLDIVGNPVHPPADLKGSLGFVHSDDLAEVTARLEGCIRRGEAHEMECRVVWRDGRERQALVRMEPVFDAQGRVVKVVGISQDVTERRRAEHEARMLSHAVARSTVSIVVADPTGRIEYVNPHFTECTGYALEECKGLDAAGLLSPSCLPQVQHEIQAALRAGREWAGEVRTRRKDGSEFWERVVIAPVLAPDGRVTRAISWAQDITEQKRLDEALEEARQQLVQAQKLEAVGRLAGGVAHDFNNLLTVITGNCELLRGQTADPEVVELLGEALGAARRGAALTRQLLAFSRQQPQEPVRVELNHALSGFAPILGRLIGEDVQLVLDLSPHEIPVEIEPTRLEQIVMNLAVNARDAMPDGGRLTIRTHPRTCEEPSDCGSCQLPPGCYAVMEVADSGMGMDEATQARLFEPFFTTKPPGQGTGLGLSTVYGIVRQLGGAIAVQSHPGEGTRFTILLPQKGAPTVEVPPTAAVDPPRSSGQRILLVEDLPDLRRLFSRLLGRKGYQVTAVESAEAALEARETSAPFDLLVTDVTLPGVSGRILAARLQERDPGLRVLLMSGYSQETLPREYPFLPKPFTPDLLCQRVAEVLAEERAPVPVN